MIIKLILFSTCNSVGGDDRAVLLGKLIPTDEESLYINEKTGISLEKIDKQLDESKDRSIIIPDAELYRSDKKENKLLLPIIIVVSVIILIGLIVVIVKKKNSKDKRED